MLKKIKSPGIICIILAITTLLLAATIGIIWSLLPQEEEGEGDDFFFQGNSNLSSNAVLYYVSSNETLGSVYLKSQSYGNFDGKKWDVSVPEYDELIYGTYSASYLTSMALKNSSADAHLITIKPATNKYVLPYYVSTDAYGDYKNIQTSDIKNEGNANATYSVYFYKYEATDEIAQSVYVAEYESEYSKFVKDNYLYVDDDTLAFLEGVISENNFSASDSDIISKVTLYVRNLAKYSLAYDTELDKEENSVISFMSGEYESGVCRHFASSATLLYRALGIPARYTTGYLTWVPKDVLTPVTALNAHAWVEVYIDGIGWIKVEPTPPTELENPSDDADAPVQSIGLFKVTSDVDTSVLLKTHSYCDYVENSWDNAYEYLGTMAGGYSAQYMTGKAIAESGYMYGTKRLEITPLADIYALPYYVTTNSDDSHTIQSSDRVVSGDTSGSYTVNYYDLFVTNEKGTSYSFLNFSKKYGEYAKEYYTTVDAETYAYLNYLIESQGWSGDDETVVAKVCNYLQDNYNCTIDYDPMLDESNNRVIDFLEIYKEGMPEHFVSVATLIFRALGIPARYTEGYKAIVFADNVSVITSDNAYCWVEVYKEDCGWIATDVFKKYVIEEGPDIPDEPDDPTEVEIEELFYVYSDSDNDRLYLKNNSFGAYNGKGFDDMTVFFGKYYNGYSAAYIPGMLIEMGDYTESNIYIQMGESSYDVGYMLPYYMPIVNYNAEIQYDDVSISGPSNSSYYARYYDYNYLTSIHKNSSLADFEKEYRDFVYQNYLGIDIQTQAYIYYNVIYNQGFDTSSPYIINEVASYIQNTAIYDLQYDRALDDEENVVIAFLDSYKTGVCRHYAMAATMVYRALGIPARYTTGFVTETVESGWVAVTNMDAHAWVEVYVDGFGWKPIEVTGGFGGNRVDEEQVEVVEITFEDTETQFSGGDWYPSVGYTGFETYESMGYTLQVTPYVPMTMPGMSKIQIANYWVYDPDGNDVTDKFNIVLSEDSGECFTYIDEISIYSNSGSVAYNGGAYSGDYFGYVINGTPLYNFYFENPYFYYTGEYHSVEITDSAYITNVGTVSNKFDFRITYNGEDVTGYYKIIQKSYGDITVTPRNITLKPEDARLSFDEYVMFYLPYNMAFTHSVIEVVDDIFDYYDGLVYGHRIETVTEGADDRVTTGEIYLPGKVDNNVIESKIIILNEFGEDVTKNYNIMTQTGYLEIG